MRLFFAIMLPSDVQAAIYRMRAELAWLPIRPSYSPQQNLHITLKFIGEVSDPDAAGLAQAAAGVRLAAPLQLRADHIVLFPPRGSARVLGVGFAGDVDPLCRLQSDLETLCRQRGLAAENRAYTPHATLARFRDGLHAKHHPRILEAWQGLPAPPPFTASAYQLMHSVLSAGGSQYTPVATFGLAG